MHSLLHKLENTWGETALVRRSANCFEEGVNWKVTTFLVQASLTKYSQSQCAWSKLHFMYSLGYFLTTPGPACSDSGAWNVLDSPVVDQAFLWSERTSRNSFPSSSLLTGSRDSLLLLVSIYQILYFVNLFVYHIFAPFGDVIFM